MVFGFVVRLIPFPHQSCNSNFKQRLSVFSFACFVWDKLIYGSFCRPITGLLGLIYRTFSVNLFQTLICVSLALFSQPF